MREAFALQKLLIFFNKKYWPNPDINILNFNETLTNDVVNFEQLGPAWDYGGGGGDQLWSFHFCPPSQ